jgi:glycosyltransferase involved in cell wall biosynthesis
VLASADHELFATASLALLEQPARRAAMRAAGPRRVRARFSFEQLTSQLLDLYAQLGLR